MANPQSQPISRTALAPGHDGRQGSKPRTHLLRKVSRQTRKALTLIEMLVSVTLTLLVVFAIVQVFEFLGDSVSLGRATIEMAGQLRSASHQLQTDLDNRTCPVKPWIDPGSGLGYFEYIEGPKRDADWSAATLPAARPALWAAFGADPTNTTLGDFDDMLMMTVKSTGQPFRGKLTYYTNGGVVVDYPYDANGQVLNNLVPVVVPIESSVAEVTWWLQFDPQSQSRVLRRRVLLVLPALNTEATINAHAGFVSGSAVLPVGQEITADYLRAFHNDNDLSVNVVEDAVGEQVGLSANSLSDLTTPRNRFGHYRLAPNQWFVHSNSLLNDPSGGEQWYFPADLRYFRPLNLFNAQAPTGNASFNVALGVTMRQNGTVLFNRVGEDIILADVQAFDVKAYDPTAPVNSVASVGLVPSDVGYASGATVGAGAFVDLAYEGTGAGTSVFSDNPSIDPVTRNGVGIENASPPVGPVDFMYAFYDTWTLGYERDGIDQDDNNLVDEGFNGLDDITDPPDPPTDGVDDFGERESAPPYDVPLRGIEVKLRMIEVSTQQVRQVSVVGDFTDF